MCPSDHPARRPIEDAAVQRLLGVVDDRLGLRRDGDALDPPSLPTPPVVDHATFAEADAIRRLSAPLFDAGKGGPLARLVKRLLNAPLRVVTTPQLYFNAAVRRILGGWGAFLRGSADFQKVVHAELADQRRRLHQLERRLAARAPLEGCVLELTCGQERRLVVTSRRAERTELVADLDALPVAPASATELTAVGLLEGLSPRTIELHLLPHWRDVLRPGGRLRLRSLAPCAVYTPDVLLTLLARAGFVDCRALAGEESEVDVVAHRPASP
jgi:hypothetical protein